MSREIKVKMTDEEINGLNLMRAIATAPQSKNLMLALILSIQANFKPTKQYGRPATTDEILDEVNAASKLIERCSEKLQKALGDDYNLELGGVIVEA